MPLAMQGDKLFPCRENVVRGGASLGAPNRGCRDHLLHASGNLGEAAPAEFGHHAVGVGRIAMGENVDQRSLYLRSLGMAQLDCGELLQVVVKEPRVIDDGLENERFAPGDGGTIATVNRACRELWTCRDVGLVSDQPAVGARTVARGARTRAISVRPP